MKKTNNKLIINFFALIAGLMLCFSAIAEEPESDFSALPSMVQNTENTSMRGL